MKPYSKDLGTRVLAAVDRGMAHEEVAEAFSEPKAPLRKAKARTRVALLGAIGRALSAITPQDAGCYFGHGGHPLGALPS